MTAPAADRLPTLVRRPGDRPRCALLPGAGGGVMPYLPLAALLGRTHDVHLVRARGLGPAEEPDTDVPAMAAAALDVLEARAALPDLVVGWSLGGAVAWELALLLAGRRPDLVLLDATPLPRRATPAGDAEVTGTVLGMLGPRPAADTVERVRRVVDGQLAALGRYRAGGPYPGRVLVVGSTAADRVLDDAAADRWAELAPAARVHRVGIGHYAMLAADGVAELAGFLEPFLTPAARVSG